MSMNTTNMHIPSNRVRDIERYFITELDGLYPEGERRMFATMLFEAFLGWDRTQLLLHRDDTINQSDLLRFHWAVEDLKRYRPIQHIIGYTEFCGLRINVSPNVLVPRPETEEMVTLIIQWLESRVDNPSTAKLHILDICTGSGCIAIALKRHFPQAEVTGVDLSAKALDMAKCNALQNDSDIRFRPIDVLNKEQMGLLHGEYDLIVSNPPYVMERERTTMSHNVLDYDPPMALFVPDDDPLIFYRAIGQFASTHLKTKGLLATEINELYGEEVRQLFETMNLDSSLNKDSRDKDRTIFATPRG